MRIAVALVVVTAAAAGFACVGQNLTPQPAPTPMLPECTPNNDGTIAADQLPVALGATLDFYTTSAGQTRTVDLAGSGSANVWDLSGNTGDGVVAIGPVALEDQWYASQFPSSQFVLAASYGSDGLDGVYHQDDQALWLDGTASHDENPPSGKTLIAYATPVALLRFPITDGDTYTTMAPLPAAEIDGLPFIGADTFEVDVSGAGQLELPDVDFAPVLRVRTSLTRAPSAGSPVISTRTIDFLFQCFGEIAHAESEPDDPDPDFTTAALLERYALGQ